MCEPCQDLLGAFGERAGIGRPARQRRHRRGPRADEVARRLDVNRQRLLARVAQHARDRLGRASGIVEHRLVAGDLAKHRELGVDAARLVMQQEAARALARARRAGDHHHGRALRVGAGDCIDQVERAGPIGDHGDAQALVIARGRVGREADPRLVAQRVVRQDARFLDRLVERKDEIARDAENLARAVLLQALEQRGRERGHASRARASATIGSGIADRNTLSGS